METWDAVRARRNVRQYTDQPIAHEDLFGQATACMMLTAADLGIGSGHSAVADQEQARRVLGSPTAISVCT